MKGKLNYHSEKKFFEVKKAIDEALTQHRLSIVSGWMTSFTPFFYTHNLNNMSFEFEATCLDEYGHKKCVSSHNGWIHRNDFKATLFVKSKKPKARRRLLAVVAGEFSFYSHHPDELV